MDEQKLKEIEEHLKKDVFFLEQESKRLSFGRADIRMVDSINTENGKLSNISIINIINDYKIEIIPKSLKDFDNIKSALIKNSLGSVDIINKDKIILNFPNSTDLILNIANGKFLEIKENILKKWKNMREVFRKELKNLPEDLRKRLEKNLEILMDKYKNQINKFTILKNNFK